MRIAQIAPLQTATPPHAYGGTERVISNLTESLVQLGHEVTLFATGDSRTSARLVSGAAKPANFDPEIEVNAYHLAMLKRVYEHADEFDIIHSHIDYLTLPFVGTTTTPTVVTLHGRSDRPELTRVYQTYGDANVNFVAISRSQRRAQPNLNWIATVHHGIDIRSYTYCPDPDNYLCFVGRISPEKRPERAIEIAKRVGLPLKIAAKIGPQDQEYFDSVVEPLLEDSSVDFLGQLDENSKRELIGHALALLLPIDWPEPFGMVFIEALACGTPVLTCPIGAAPEVLTDGVTGYLRKTVDELVQAVYDLPHISRARCRRYAAERFDMRRMTMDYVNVYSRLLGGGTLFRQSPPTVDDLTITDSAGDSTPGGMAPLETIDGVSGYAL